MLQSFLRIHEEWVEILIAVLSVLDRYACFPVTVNDIEISDGNVVGQTQDGFQKYGCIANY